MFFENKLMFFEKIIIIVIVTKKMSTENKKSTDCRSPLEKKHNIPDVNDICRPQNHGLWYFSVISFEKTCKIIAIGQHWGFLCNRVTVINSYTSDIHTSI